MQPRVAVILVNFNSSVDTIECIFSLKQVHYKNLKLLIVDNGSSDGSVKAIKERSPETEIVETGKNLGFAGGNNYGIRHLMAENPKYILLLNNDTCVEPDFLDPLVAALEVDETLGAAGGTICYHPDVERLWYAGGKFVFWRATSIHRHLDQSYEVVRNLRPHSVTFVTGCLLLLRSSAIEKIGLLDERFFMYCEDVDMCLRIMASGYKLWYVPQSRIYHKIRHRGETPMRLYYGMRSRFILVDSFPPGLKKIIAQIYLMGIYEVKQLLWKRKKPMLNQVMRFALEDFRNGVLGSGRGSQITHDETAERIL